MKVAAISIRTHNPSDEACWVSRLGENLTSGSDGEGLETDRRQIRHRASPVPYPTVVFQGDQTEFTGQDLRGHLGQCCPYSNLDSIDRDPLNQVSPIQVALRLASAQSGGLAALKSVHLSELVDMDRSTLYETANHTRAHPNGFFGNESWTA